MEGEYADPQQPSTGAQFAQFIFDEWKETSDMGKRVRYNMMGNKKVTADLNEFIVLLSGLWMQLAPKVRGLKSSKDKELEKKFFSFQQYSTNPTKIIEITAETAQKEQIFLMEEVIRMVIEELGITEWGR